MSNLKKDMKVYLQELKNSHKKETLNELFIQMKDIINLKSPQKEHQMLRLGIIAEADAVNLYETMASNTSHPLLKKLFLDVAKEEKVHIGEFEEVLESIDKEYDEAEEEAEEELKDMGFDNI